MNNDLIIYQIYPKSFCDSNNDGIGDIQGIISKLDYLSELGINTIWLNPIFKSPQKDNGYDVSDYLQIDPIFGTMEDVLELIEKAHQKNLKIIFDLVLNHTSDQHPWFQKALLDPNSKYRNYYHFVDEIPNNWGSFFGGSAFEKADNGLYYFHLFDQTMPDLNWENPLVMEEMLEVAKFWLDKGIAGFRLDAFIHMAKDDFSKQAIPENEIVVAEEFYANLPKVDEYISCFINELKKQYPQSIFIGEAASATTDDAIRYQKYCDSIITFRYFEEEIINQFPTLNHDYQPRRWKKENFKALMNDWQLNDRLNPSLYWNNHDMGRLINRFGDLKYRFPSAKCLATLMYLQRGIPIILYGEELGMLNFLATDINDLERVDAKFWVNYGVKQGFDFEELLNSASQLSRFASRGYMQWDDGKYHGFSDHEPWIINNEDSNCFKVQENDKDSLYHYYKQLFTLKKLNVFINGSYEDIPHQSLYKYRRKLNDDSYIVVCNLNDVEIDYTPIGEIILENNYYNNKLLPFGSLVIKESNDEFK